MAFCHPPPNVNNLLIACCYSFSNNRGLVDAKIVAHTWHTLRYLRVAPLYWDLNRGRYELQLVLSFLHLPVYIYSATLPVLPGAAWLILTGRLRKKTWSQGLPAYHRSISTSHFIFAGIDYWGNKKKKPSHLSIFNSLVNTVSLQTDYKPSCWADGEGSAAGEEEGAGGCSAERKTEAKMSP